MNEPKIMIQPASGASIFLDAYGLLISFGTTLRSPFLLAVRLCWGTQFIQTGYGKLNNLDHVTSFFASLHIPFPAASAMLVGCTELFGGICLTLGLASRAAAIPLCITLFVAYLTSEHPALKALFTFKDVNPFLTADPFLFLLASAIILIFGPGFFSLDEIIARRWRR